LLLPAAIGVSIYLVNQRDTLAEKLKFNRSVPQNLNSLNEQQQQLHSSKAKAVELPVEK
jgi:hypothetical protein